MSWTSKEDNQATSVLDKVSKEIATKTKFVIDRTPAAVLELPSAKEEVENAKIAVNQSINYLNSIHTTMKNRIDDINTRQQELRQNVVTTNDAVKTMEASVAQANELNELRKEQVAALVSKTSGNYHSSWMGLFRPMKEGSRVAILILAILFAAFFILLLIFASKNGYLSVSKDSLKATLSGSWKLVKDAAVSSATGRILFG